MSKTFSGIHLCFLGGVRVQSSRGDLTREIKYRKGLALLGYLACHPGVRHSRERLAELLWPGLGLVAARTNLRQVVNNLASVLNQDGVILEKDASLAGLSALATSQMDISLLADAALDRMTSDTQEARAWRQQKVEPLAGHLSKEFLADLHLSDTPEFDEWLTAMRGHYLARSSLLLERLCDMQEKEGRYAEAVSTARILVSLGDFNESHHQRLMALLMASGDARGALEVFAALRDRLAADMGIQPGPALLALRDELSRQLDRGTAEVRDARVAEMRQLSLLYCTAEDLAEDDIEGDFAASMQAAVKRRGGLVVSGVGRGMLAVFGLAGSAERAAQRAILAARDLLPSGSCAAEHLPRMGISAGRVLLRPAPGGPHLAGEIPDLAKLIGWAAQPGELLVNETVAQQAAAWFSFEAIGDHDFQGISGRHPLYRVTGERDGRPREDVALVGRQAELQVLLDAWQDACAGQPSLVVLRAPAGFGKTRLAGELAARVTQQGGRVRRIQCALEHVHQPLAAIVAALSEEAVSDLAETGDGMLLAASKSDIFHRVLLSLQSEYEDGAGPLLLLVDDLHWSDLATRELLTLLAGSLQHQKLLLVLTTRPDVQLDHAGHKLRMIDVPPLNESGVEGMILAHDPERCLTAAERREILVACGGVPLFIECLVKSRLEGRHHRLSITEALQSELDGLGIHKRVLHAAAVLGNRFSRGHLALLVPEADVHGALTRATGRRLIDNESAETCSFRHALIRDAVYDNVPGARRKGLHDAVARLLIEESSEIAPGEIARHLAAAGRKEEAVGWWLKAGDAEMRREFAADAMASYREALAMLQADGVKPDVDRLRLLRMRLGYAAQVAEGYGSPLTYQLFLDMVADIEAGEAPPPGLLFSALCGCYMGSSSFGRDDGINIARRLETLATTDAERLMVCFAYGNTLLWRGEFAAAEKWQRQGIALAGQLPLEDRICYGVDDLAITCRANLCWTLWFLGDEAAACAMAEEAVAVARHGRRAHTQCFALSFAVGLHWFRQDGARVAALAQEALVLAGQYRFPLWEGINRLFLLGAVAWQHEMTDKQALFDAAALMQQAIPGRAQTCRWIVGRALIDQGEWQAAEALLDVALAEAPDQEEQYCQADLLHLKAACLARWGDAAGASDYRRRAVRLAETQGAPGLRTNGLRQISGRSP